MRMLYDTSCEYYLPNIHYDYVSISSVAISRTQQLSIDIEELKRLLVLFTAALAINGIDSSNQPFYPQGTSIS